MVWEQVEACWVTIAQDYFYKLIVGMPVRVEAVRMARDRIFRF
jgi:hypothetical protein